MSKAFDEALELLYPGDPCLEELKAAAFEVLLLNPGSDEPDWAQTIIESYPTEVVDAYGTNPEEVNASLADLWDDFYCDPVSGIENRFREWAAAFATEWSVQMYYDLTDKLNEK